jgi:hypothetical protein
LTVAQPWSASAAHSHPPFYAAFEDAFIAVEELATINVKTASGISVFPLSQNDLEWPKNFATPPVHVRGFETSADLGDFFTRGSPRYAGAPYRDTLPEDNDYWTMYAATIYEGLPDTSPPFFPDNDPNSEIGVPAMEVDAVAIASGARPEFAVIFHEVIRDIAVEHGWSANQANLATEVITLHEVGHSFGLPHRGVFPDDIMKPPSTEVQQALTWTVDPGFQPWALEWIRRFGGTKPPLDRPHPPRP